MENENILTKEQLVKAFDLLSTAKCQMDFNDYKKAFGPLAEHIWNQEGSSLLRIWRSGLTAAQKRNLVACILNRKFNPMP